MKTTIDLDGIWQLYFAPEEGEMIAHPDGLEGSAMQRIPASVPGNVELDLVAAGLEQDPFFGTNCFNFRKYEFYTWWFVRTVEIPAAFAGKALVLRFEGLDTYADIWVNGQLAGSTDNMLIPHEIDVNAFVTAGETATLAVHIHSATNKARKEYYPMGISTWSPWGQEFAKIRKPPHSFGWDISGRMLSAGMWRSVQLIAREDTRFTEVYGYVFSLDRYKAVFGLRYRFDTSDTYMNGLTVTVAGTCGDSSFSSTATAFFNVGSMKIDIPAPKLWWPIGYGHQNLYDVTVTLAKDGVTVDTYQFKTGIRTVDIEQRFDMNDQQFLISVNNTPIMAKGTNWVFLDLLHSRDIERLPKAHEMLRACGCNMVRLWGGNVYESDEFYDLCDEHGILVWQDFSMACAVYDQFDDFTKVIEQEASATIIRLRNHPSIALWAGDNEVDYMYFELGEKLAHTRYNKLTREVIPRCAGMHDPFRYYMPSSPYVPENHPDIYQVPEQHNWGPRDYFKGDFYKNTTAKFISETGYHGCPSASMLKSFIPEGEVWPYDTYNESWTTHSSDYILAGRRDFDRNGLMFDQVKALFGHVPESLEDFILASQISQAEAKKFFIEAVRVGKWNRTGILWWNLLDGWPQISDAVVDYDFRPKLAYHYISRVQQPLCLIMGESDSWQHKLYFCNDSLTSYDVAYSVRDHDSGALVCEGTLHSPANENVVLPPIASVPGEQRLFILEWEIGGQRFANHYASGFIPMDFERYKRWLTAIEQLPEAFSTQACIG